MILVTTGGASYAAWHSGIVKKISVLLTPSILPMERNPRPSRYMCRANRSVSFGFPQGVERVKLQLQSLHFFLGFPRMKPFLTRFVPLQRGQAVMAVLSGRQMPMELSQNEIRGHTEEPGSNQAAVRFVQSLQGTGNICSVSHNAGEVRPQFGGVPRKYRKQNDRMPTHVLKTFASREPFL